MSIRPLLIYLAGNTIFFFAMFLALSWGGVQNADRMALYPYVFIQIVLIALHVVYAVSRRGRSSRCWRK